MKLHLFLLTTVFLISSNNQGNKSSHSISKNNADTSIVMDAEIIRDTVFENNPVPSDTIGTEIIRDTVFENVIEIRKNNVVTTGTDYLFDVSIPASTKTPMLYISAEVPSKLLPTIYPEFQKLTIITPNWALINDKSFSALEKRAPSFIIYKFNKQSGQLVKDSLVIMHFPEMKFAEKYRLKKNEKEFYYGEYYGSFCCPKDPQYENKPTRDEFIKFFEKENNVKIIDTYRESYGKEGEHRFLYPLKGLPNLLKLEFILDRDYPRIINSDTKYIVRTPIIYTPFILEINDNMKKI